MVRDQGYDICCHLESDEERLLQDVRSLEGKSLKNDSVIALLMLMDSDSSNIYRFVLGPTFGNWLNAATKQKQLALPTQNLAQMSSLSIVHQSSSDNSSNNSSDDSSIGFSSDSSFESSSESSSGFGKPSKKPSKVTTFVVQKSSSESEDETNTKQQQDRELEHEKLSQNNLGDVFIEILRHSNVLLAAATLLIRDPIRSLGPFSELTPSMFRFITQVLIEYRSWLEISKIQVHGYSLMTCFSKLLESDNKKMYMVYGPFSTLLSQSEYFSDRNSPLCAQLCTEILTKMCMISEKLALATISNAKAASSQTPPDPDEVTSNREARIELIRALIKFTADPQHCRTIVQTPTPIMDSLKQWAYSSDGQLSRESWKLFNRLARIPELFKTILESPFADVFGKVPRQVETISVYHLLKFASKTLRVDKSGNLILQTEDQTSSSDKQMNLQNKILFTTKLEPSLGQLVCVYTTRNTTYKGQIRLKNEIESFIQGVLDMKNEECAHFKDKLMEHLNTGSNRPSHHFFSK